jgi:hypothetical protein
VNKTSNIPLLLGLLTRPPKRTSERKGLASGEEREREREKKKYKNKNKKIT